MRRPLIAANWKMNAGTVDEALTLVRALRSGLSRLAGVDVVLCPPFTVLASLAEVLRQSSIALGAQNMHWEPRGAFTGEIAPTMLAGLCRYVILGHSERRALGGTSDDDGALNRKVRAALAQDLTPILCAGESAREHEEADTERVVSTQVLAALDGLRSDQVATCVIAYEPIWAIGTGHSATPTLANRTIGLAIRRSVATQWDERTAESVRVLYGGSVTTDNIASFMAMPEIDGALVGGASLSPEFVALVGKVVG